MQLEQLINSPIYVFFQDLLNAEIDSLQAQINDKNLSEFVLNRLQTKLNTYYEVKDLANSKLREEIQKQNREDKLRKINQ